MGMVTSSGFANQTITVLKKSSKIGPHHDMQISWEVSNSYKACVYSKTLHMGFTDQGLWKENTLYVAMIDYTTDSITLADRIRFNGTDYAIDYVDDIAFQHEAIFIGLRMAI